jgi:hypothetical protein
VHIVALAMLFGAVIFVDLQMLGIIRSDTPVSRLERSLSPVDLLQPGHHSPHGFLLFASEATKLYNSAPFRIKVVMLLLALVFPFHDSSQGDAERKPPDRYEMGQADSGRFVIALDQRRPGPPRDRILLGWFEDSVEEK